MPVLDAVMQTNAAQPQQILELLHVHEIDVYKERIAVLGLAFKPGTDDIRESPALPVIDALANGGANLVCYDPAASQTAQQTIKHLSVEFAESMHDAITDASVVIIMTAWPEFLELPTMLSSLNNQPLVVDGRRMLPIHSVERYAGIGLGKVVEELCEDRSSDGEDNQINSAA